MSGKTESGLSRWARRKAAVRETRDATGAKRGAALPAAAAPDAQSQRPPETAAPTGDIPGTPDREAGAAADPLPDIETLDYDSDYAGFLSEDVSDAVRNIALRKLWRSNPVLANVDGLVDYDDDFTDAATVIEGMKSVYRVGRGMVEDEPAPPEEEPTTTADEPEQPSMEGDDALVSDDGTDAPTQSQEPETEGDGAIATDSTVGEEDDGKKPVDAT